MPVQPERPVVVLAESRPSPPVVLPSPASQAPRPVWDWFPAGTWLVAVAGLLVGGLVVRLLAGPPYKASSIGVGLGELMLLGAVVVLAVRGFLRRRASQRLVSAPASVPRYREEPPPGPPTDFQRGIAAIRHADRGFEPAGFASYAGMMFRDVEDARAARDARPLRNRLTSEMYAELETSCEALRAAGRSVRNDEVDVEAQVTEAWQDGDQDYLTACVSGSILTHTVETVTGVIVSGSRTTATAVEAFLTFTRPAGLNFWMLSIIQERGP
jgi:predicted lipid-binding transport protein (Tim44 family)